MKGVIDFKLCLNLVININPYNWAGLKSTPYKKLGRLLETNLYFMFECAQVIL